MKRATLAACTLALLVAAVGLACTGEDPAPAWSTKTDDGGVGVEASLADAPPPDSSASCAQTRCGDACVDLQTAQAHCGACDNDCGGGACHGGVCQPVTIASGLESPAAIAVEGNAVVWLRSGALESCPVGGCTSPKKLTGEGETYPRAHTAKVSGRLVATTASHVFWIGNGTPSSSSVRIFKCPLSGCTFGTPVVFHDPGTGELVGQLATEGSKLFFTQKFLGVRECDATLASCATPIPVNGTGGDQEFGLAVDTQKVYFTYTFSAGNGGGVFACARGGCGAPPNAPLADPAWSVAWMAGMLYINQYGTISSCLATGCAGTPTELAAGQDISSPITADGVGVYWLRAGAAVDGGAADGQVLMCELPSCAGGPRVLASGQASPNSLAVQDGFVYWVSRGVQGTAKSGSVMRVRR